MSTIVRNDSTYTLGAFFYPWYGKWRHWTDGGHNPPATWGSYFLPQIFPGGSVSDNLYDNNDVNTIKRQIQLMVDCGIQFGISSWWGQGTFEDIALQKII